MRRLGLPGGRALSDGVIMRCGQRIAAARIQKDGQIQVCTGTVRAPRLRLLRRIPVLRGVLQLVESASSSGTVKRQGKGAYRALLIIAYIVFIVAAYCAAGYFFEDIIEGLPYDIPQIAVNFFLLLLFVPFILLIYFFPPIRELLRYHGAEHKTLTCFERGIELTEENVNVQTRFHPRCGTSVAVWAISAELLAAVLVPENWNEWLQTVLFVSVAVICAGASYEMMRYSSTHGGRAARIFAAPGLWAQRITTAEPDSVHIRCAVAALQAVTKEN